MKQKKYLFINLILLTTFISNLNAQELLLKLSSKNKTVNSFLQQITFLEKHNDTISVNNELNKISNQLKNIGYFLNNIDSISKTNNTQIAYFSLNKKINIAELKFSKNQLELRKSLRIKNNAFKIPINELQPLLRKISKKLESQGKSFSKVQLKNITIKEDFLFADINIYQSKKRTINNIIVKGYKEFPKSYVKHYFNIDEKSIFNQQKLKDFATMTKSLSFIKEIKPPEILFTKDSTLLYLYVKKNKTSSFDGMVNFSSKENGGILFNGYLDLKLNNILDTGEEFEIYWNSINKQNQEFRVSTKVPYIFNSAFTPKISFSLYKKDSTFLNTKFDAKLYYDINPKIKVASTYNIENSENLQKDIQNDIATYSNYFLGIEFEYSIPKEGDSYGKKLLVRINPSFGKRTTDIFSSEQFKIEATASYIWDINLRNSFFIRNKTGYLNSNNIINNELFRIGGANSIRGFNEQSILAKEYSYFNIEYRHLTSEKSYLYTITDLGTADNKNFIGLGLGHLFNAKNSIIKLSLVTGKATSQNTNLKNTKLIINFASYF